MRRSSKRFFFKLIVFCVSLIPAYLGLHTLISALHHWARTKEDPGAIYVIGDSRTYNSVDVTVLHEALGCPVYSHAQPAMSAYSVLKLAETVPPGATVLLGLSMGMLLRDGESASYRSGFSLHGLMLLLERGNVAWQLRRIFVINRIPVEAPFFRTTPPLPGAVPRSMAKLEKVRSFYLMPRPPYFENKRRILSEAVRILLEKGCRIEVVVVPVPGEIEVIREATYGSVVDQLEVLNDPNVRIHTGIELVEPEGRNIWRDADHVNARGRKLMTEYLARHVLHCAG